MEENFFMWLLSWRRIFFHLAYRADGESYKDRVATIPWGRKGPPNILYYINPGNMETLITILPCPSNWRNVACLRLHRLFRSPWNPRWPMNSPSSYYRQFLGLPYSMTSLSDCVNFGRTLDLEKKIQKKNSYNLMFEKNWLFGIRSSWIRMLGRRAIGGTRRVALWSYGSLGQRPLENKRPLLAAAAHQIMASKCVCALLGGAPGIVVGISGIPENWVLRLTGTKSFAIFPSIFLLYLTELSSNI